MTTQPSEVPWISRQLAPEVTVEQCMFDILFGIALPLLCFAVDPILYMYAGLDWYWLYVFVGLAMIGLCVWLSTGRFSGLFAGLFLLAGACSILMALLILPFTIMGIFFVVGVLGFVPFLTSFVYFRNAARAWHADESDLRELGALAGLMLGFAPAIYPLYGRSLVAKTTRAVVAGDDARTDELVARIRSMPIPISTDPLVWAYIGQDSGPVRTRLAEAYEEITGEEIYWRESELDGD